MLGDINKITHDDIGEFKTFLNPAGGSNALDEYQRIATKNTCYPGQGSPLGLMYVGLKGAGEAGEFAEHVGQAMRDDAFGNGMYFDNGVVQYAGVSLTPDRHAALVKEIGDQLWYLSAKCNELGITLSQAALENLKKLCGRTARGKLQGSGDNR